MIRYSSAAAGWPLSNGSTGSRAETRRGTMRTVVRRSPGDTLTSAGRSTSAEVRPWELLSGCPVSVRSKRSVFLMTSKSRVIELPSRPAKQPRAFRTVRHIPFERFKDNGGRAHEFRTLQGSRVLQIQGGALAVG